MFLKEIVPFITIVKCTVAPQFSPVLSVPLGSVVVSPLAVTWVVYASLLLLVTLVSKAFSNAPVLSVSSPSVLYSFIFTTSCHCCCFKQSGVRTFYSDSQDFASAALPVSSFRSVPLSLASLPACFPRVFVLCLSCSSVQM